MINDFGGIIAFAIAWLASQLGKLLGALIKNKGKLSPEVLWSTLMKSGGMPSGHTASFTALTAFLGLKLGWSADVFVLALCMLMIVAYDAMNVRWAVGEQGKELNEVIREKKGDKAQGLKVVEGHTLPQVLVGAVLGVLIGVGTYYLTLHGAV